MLEIRNRLNPKESEWVRGPRLARMKTPWDEFQGVQKCIVLDQDDYIIVRNNAGLRNVIAGPLIYSHDNVGEVVDFQGSAILCPVNHYLIVNDADSTEAPVVHLRGPRKWYPQAFQKLTRAADGTAYHPCIEITLAKGVHLQRATGEVVLMEEPMFYMPDIGEKVIDAVKRVVLLTTDFAIIKSPNGGVHVKSGTDDAQRSFVLAPFEQLVSFSFGSFGKKTVLSTLPTFLPHKFNVRTSDNVVMLLDMRVNFRVCNIPLFSANPIEFYGGIQNHVQNNLLDKFAQCTLSQFMSSFGTISESEVQPVNEYFQTFGIEVSALQIMNYTCDNQVTQDLLWQDIHTTVKQQSELRARQTDVYIQEQVNEVQRKQKDLEVALVNRDNEIRMEFKRAENSLRVREMEIEIQEEEKRSELLEIKRGNDLSEAEFEGRAKGAEFREFLGGIDRKLTHIQKLDIYNKKCDMTRTKTLYSKAEKMIVYPSGVDVETYQLGKGKDIHLEANRLGYKDDSASNEYHGSRGKQRWEEIQKAKEASSSSKPDVMPGSANLSYTSKNDVQVAGLGSQFRSNYQDLHDDKVTTSSDAYAKAKPAWKTVTKKAVVEAPRAPPPPPKPKLPPPPKWEQSDLSACERMKTSGDQSFAKKQYSSGISSYAEAIEKIKSFTLEAITDRHLAEETKKLLIKCYNNRGLCYKMSGDKMKAIADCLLSMSINGNDKKIQLRLNAWRTEG